MTDLMNQYIDQFRTFAAHEELAEVDISDRVKLFTSYCQMVTAQKTAAAAPKQQVTSNRRTTTSNAPATPKQKGLLKSLINDGYLENQGDLDSLTKRSASKLIDTGLGNKNSNTKVNQPKEEKEFAGSYNLF